MHHFSAKFQKAPKIIRIITLSLYCITLSVICQCLFTQPANANTVKAANNFYFQDFSADYYLSRDEDGTSRLKVIEKIVAVFPKSDQNHGITRIIPYTNQDGHNLTMASDRHLDLKIKHNGIAKSPYKIETDDGYFTVYIGNPSEYVHERQVYELEYEFQNVITQPSDNPNHQELYWDTNGNDWSQRFENISARVHFVGQDVKQAFDGQSVCYTGRYGDKTSGSCTIKQIEDGIEFRASKLGARENLTFALEFNQNTFAMPGRTYDYRIVWAVVVEILAALLLAGLIFILHTQTKAKRQYYNQLFITPEYTPPSDFTVAEMATNYVGKRILGSSKVATLMELAVKHKIELTKVGTEKKPQWTIKILSTDLSAEQSDTLKLLAGRNDKLKVGQEILIKVRHSDKTLVKLEQDYNKHLETRLQETKLHDTKTSKNQLCNTLFVIGIGWVILSIAIFPFLIDDDIPSYVTLYGGGWLIAVMILLAVIIAISIFYAASYYQKFYTHTEAGLKWSRYLDGLRLYIKMAEQDRIKFLQSVKGVDTSNQGIVNLYEKLLPYAVIFRLETSWLKEMSKYYDMDDVSAPVWYIGGAAFSAQDFTSAMRSINSAALTANMAAHSSSSGSSSGFSGVGGSGFSGGGGGGGGGGGW